MGRSIDERIVQMRFENGQFERGVRTSINTINSLKKSMNFEGSVKGMAELDRAARNVKMDVLGNSVEAVKVKFSALQIIAITALQRITNQAMATGERLIKSLSVEQINAGWDKFANKTGAVQTIMAATAKQFTDTGEQMQFVEGQLDKLNWFTDETSYNFVDMVSNIGKFTSNNIALDDSVTAMQGIANWAAISGANASDASRAMYNLSQAISSGVLRLEDWMSIENANMGTAAFKEMTIQSGIAAGTLVKNGDKIMTANGKMEVSVESFRNTLSEKWLNNKVLMDTLNQYGSATNKLNAIYEAAWAVGKAVTTSDIVATVDEYTAAVKKARQESETQGDTAEVTSQKVSDATKKIVEDAADAWGISVEEAAKNLEEFGTETMQFGLKAFKAAQEAKTFSDAIESVRDAVSTGWMKSFELIFGNYLEAKELWTDVANELYTLFAESGNARNEMLAEWKKMGGHAYVVDTIVGLIKVFNNLKTAIGLGFRDAFGEMTAERFMNLTKAVHSFIVQLAPSGETFAKIGRIARGLASILDILKTVILGGVSKAFKLLSAITGNANLDILGFLANIGDVIYGFRNWVHESTILNDALDFLIDNVDKVRGSVDKIVDGFLNLRPVQAVIKAFQNIFSAFGQDAGNAAQVIKDKFKEFTEFIKTTPKIASFDDFKNAFIVFKDILKGGLDELAKAFPNTANAIRSAMNAVRTMFTVLEGPAKFIMDIFRNLMGDLKTLVDSITAVDIAIVGLGIGIFKMTSSIASAFSAISDTFESIGNVFTKPFEVLEGLGKKWVKTQQIKGFAASLLMLAVALKVLSTIDTEQAVKSGIILAALAGALLGISVVMGKIKGTKLSSAAFLAFAAGILVLAAAVAQIDKVLGDGNRLMNSLTVMASIIAGIAAMAFALSKLAPQMSASALSLVGFAASVYLMIGAIKSLGNMKPEVVGRGMTALVGMLLAIGVAMRLMNTASSTVINAGENSKVKMGGMAGTLMGLAVAVILLVIALRALGKMDAKVITQGLFSLGVVLLELSLAMRLMGSANQGGAVAKVGASILALALALNLIVPAFKALANIDMATLAKGGGAIAALGLIFAGLIYISKFSGENAAKAGLMLIEMAAAITILVVAVRALGLIDMAQLVKGVTAVSILGLVMTAAIWASKNAADAKGSLIALTVAIGIMGGLVIIMSHIEWQKLLPAAAAMSFVMLAFGGAMALMGKANFNKKILANVALLSIIAAGFGFLIAELTRIPGVEKSILVAGAIGVLLLSLSGSMRLLGNSEGVNWKVIAQLGVMGVIAVALGAVIVALSNLPMGDIGSAITIMGAVAVLMPILSACFTAMNKFTGNMKKGMMKQFAVMAGMTVAIAAIAGVILAITAIPGTDVNQAVIILGAVGVLIPILSACLFALSKIPRAPTKAMMAKFTMFATIAAALGVLIGIAAALPLKNIDNAIKIVYALETLIGAISVCFIALTFIKRSPSKAAMTALIQFSAIAAVLGGAIALLAGLLSGDANINGAMSVVGMLAVFLPVLSLCFGLLSNFAGNKLGVSGLASFAVLGVIAGVLGGAIAAFATYTDLDYDAAFKMVGVIDAFLPVLTAVAIAVSAFPVNIAAVTQAGLAIDALAALIGGFLYVVGYLPKEQLEAAVENGKLLGQAIGGFFGNVVGSLVGGVLEGVSSALPGIGTNLSTFWDNAKGFFDGVSSLDESTLTGITAVTDAIISLTLASFVNALGIIPEVFNKIAGIFGIKNDPVENFRKLGEATGAFAGELGDVDAAQIKAAAEACSILSKLDENMPRIDGPLDAFLGNKQTLEAFGAGLTTLGSSLLIFSTYTKNITAESVEGAYNAAMMMVNLEHNLPKQGGMLQDFLGSQDIGEFGQRLSVFGTYLLLFKNKVKDIKESDVTGAANAGSIMAKLEKNLVFSGGFVSNVLFGTQDIGKFGERLSSFGSAIKTYVADVTGISEEDVAGSAAALKVMADLEKQLDSTGGIGTIFFGDSSFSTFAGNLRDLGKGLQDYSNSLASTDLTQITNATNAIQALIDLGTYVQGASDWANNLIIRIGSMISILMKEIDDKEEDIKRRGKDVIKWIVEGLKLGVDEQRTVVQAVAKNLADILNDKFRATLEIDSPSAVMEENGKWIVRGIAEGIKGDTSAEEAIEKKAQNINTAFQNALKSLELEKQSMDIDYQLWQVTDGYGADGATLANAEREFGLGELEYLADVAQNKLATLQAIRQSFGESSTQFIEAQNTYKQALVSMYQKKNELDEMMGSVVTDDRNLAVSFAEALKEADTWADMLGWDQTQKENWAGQQSGFDVQGKREYDRVIAENRQAFEMLGKSSEELMAFAREKSGYGLEVASNELTETGAIIQRALEEQSVTIEQSVAAITGKAIKSGLQQGVQSADPEGVGESIHEGEATGVIKTIGLVVDALRNGQEQGYTELLDAWKINSPSHVTQRIGEGINEGLALGIQQSNSLSINALRDTANNAMQSFIGAINTKGAEAIAAATEVANQVAAKMQQALKGKTTSKTAQSIGTGVAKGISVGLTNGQTTVNSAAKGVASGVTSAMAKMLKINSPSKVTMEIGHYVGERLARGITQSIPNVNSASEDMTNNAISSMDYAKSVISDVINSDEDFSPVITPVLDMDQLKADASNIPGLLNPRGGLTLRTSKLNVSSIASKRADLNSQNGSNQPVVNNTYDFTQNNYSPKALSRSEIYRQTNNQFSRFKGATKI